MLLPSMEFNEVQKEVMRDYEIILRKATFHGRKLWRIYRNNRISRYRKAFDYTSKYGNTWFYTIEVEQKSVTYLIVLVAYYYTQKGLFAYMVTPELKLMGYTGHFFKRYRERMGKDTLDSLETMKEYFMNNPMMYYENLDQDDPDYQAIFITIPDGVALGVKRKEGVVFNTFLSNEMLRPGQIKTHASNKDILNRYIKDNYKGDWYHHD